MIDEFTKEFWNEIVDNKRFHVCISGNCYYIGKENSKDIDRGFGGRQFYIKLFKNGKIISTTNLWHNGVIPESYRLQLPDTGEFVSNIHQDSHVVVINNDRI